MPESNTPRSKTPPAGSFRRFARRHLKPGIRKPFILLELWRERFAKKRRRVPVSPERIAEAVARALANEHFSLPGTFCFIFVSKRFLKELNNQFRNVRRETDVISFSYMNFKGGKPLSSQFPRGESLADIYISEDNAAENAKRFGETIQKELLRLVIHGTLHALGYTDYETRAKKRMWARQERALRQTFA
jgi:probable rRNA maturation factor